MILKQFCMQFWAQKQSIIAVIISFKVFKKNNETFQKEENVSKKVFVFLYSNSSISHTFFTYMFSRYSFNIWLQFFEDPFTNFNYYKF
jgi:hypothetical protein